MRSAYGTKRTWACALRMSAFGGKADIALTCPESTYGPKVGLDVADKVKNCLTSPMVGPVARVPARQSAGRPYNNVPLRISEATLK